MSVTCNKCGETWPRDPALEVSCPECKVGIGQRCKRPSGHECSIHASRDRLAMEAGFLKPCRGFPAKEIAYTAPLMDKAEEQLTLF